MRDHVEMRAAQGDKRSIKKLAGLGVPRSKKYLYNMLQKLHGRLGINTEGVVPITDQSLYYHGEVMGIEFEPWQVDWLVWADRVKRDAVRYVPRAKREEKPSPAAVTIHG